MAKIIVTAYLSAHKEPEKRIIDAERCVFKENPDGGTTVIIAEGVCTVKETMEEICKLINEAESEVTNKKLDEILENQRKILEKLSEMDREVVSCEEF